MSIEEVSVDALATSLSHQRDPRDPRDVQGDVVVIDVREIDEYVSGHVPGAVHVPLGTVADNVDTFRGTEGDVTFVICKAGGRSMRAAEFLASHGVVTVNVAGGMMAWTQSGHRVVMGDQPS
jgi:rhodanese-related sulfurtransferase